ncbi:MAG: pirin family protein [Beijerinckiaceae bacterium]|nr:MAG: pirin family protein [Beijerinckiaceae bacterium]
MSTSTINRSSGSATAEPRGSRHLTQTLQGMATSDGAGVKLSRIIGQPGLPDLDPFLMLDAFNSDDPDAYIAGFPPHPHRGFETVTYMLAGAMRHRDNKGNVGLLGPGALQWMTAGRGIVHSEMPEQRDGLMRGFQLWLNLPARDKMCAPHYRDIAAEEIPSVQLTKEVRAKVLAGRIAGVRGAVEREATAPLLLDIVAEPGAMFGIGLPLDDTAFLYPYEGELMVGSGNAAKPLEQEWLGVLSKGDSLSLKAGAAGARLLLAAARPLQEPIAKYGPFVMTTEAEIKQAIDDFRADRF